MRLDEAHREARALLQDTRKPYRYEDNTLNYALLLCLNKIYMIRPDVMIGRYQDPAITLTAQDLADGSTVLPVAEPWVLGVPFGIASIAEMRDNESSSDGRAAALWDMFLKYFA
jgi:hypothetical protein